MALGATVRDLRQRNRARVLRAVLLAGETTRAQLAAGCQLSSATITNVVSDLIAAGLVQEVGLMPSDGGRPIARLSPRPEGAYVIGAGVGEHVVSVELFDLTMRPVDRVVGDARTNVASVAEVARELTDAVAALRARHPAVEGSLVGIGLGVPGLVEPAADTATIFADHLSWPATSVRELCAVDDVPVYADNGAKTLALAEQRFGAARETDHAIVALVGRGLGAGIISDGRLLRGHGGSAGEWGHTKISVGGPECICGARGCLEAWVGGGAIVSRWREADGGTDEEVFDALLTAAADGDTAANAALDAAVEPLGIGLANLVNLVNPETIIIGGWAGCGLHAARSAQLTEAVRAHSLPRPGRQFTLRRCVMGGDAVALGAALLPLEPLIEGTIPLPQVKT